MIFKYFFHTRKMALFISIALCMMLVPVSVFGEPVENQIKIGFFPLGGFNEYDANGQPQGLDVAYLNALSRYTGWTYEFVPMGALDEAMSALQRGKIDLIGGVQLTSRWANQFVYSAYTNGYTYGALLVPSTSDTILYEDFEVFNDMQIGVLRNYNRQNEFLEYQNENGFKVTLKTYQNIAQLHDALQGGEVNGIITSVLEKTENEKVVGKFAPDPLYYIANKGNNKLIGTLNKAAEKFENELPDLKEQLQKQFYTDLLQVPLTKQEQDYIQYIPELAVGCVTNPYPISDMANGNITGTIPNILNTISQQSGLSFELRPISEDDALRYAAEGGVNFVAGVPYSNETLLNPNILITMPIYKSDVVFAGNSDTILTSEKAFRIALPANKISYINYIQNTYPNFTILEYTDIVACLDALKNDEADIVMENPYVLEYLLQDNKYSKFVILSSGSWEEKYSLAMPRSTSPLLISILNKQIANLPDNLNSQLAITDITQTLPTPISAEDVIDNTESIDNEAIADEAIDDATVETIAMDNDADKKNSIKYQKPIIACALLILLYVLSQQIIRKQKKENLDLLLKNQSMITHIANTIHSGVLTLKKDENFTIIYANQGFLTLIGSGTDVLEDLVVPQCTYYIHPDDLTEFRQEMNQKRNTGDTVELDIRLIRPGGRFVSVSFCGTYVAVSKNESRFYCVVVDISNQRRMIEALEIEKERYKILIEESEDIMFDFDTDTKKLTCSTKFKNKFGWDMKQRGINSPLMDDTGVHPEDVPVLQEINKNLKRGQSSAIANIRLIKEDGTYIWCQLQIFQVGKNAKMPKLVGKLVDIDKEVKEHIRLEQLSKRDPLTSLYHKDAFKRLLEERLFSLEEKHPALLFLDLDYFKTVNDQLGHLAGDLALRDVTQALKDNINANDILCRFGGDEFCIYLDDVSEEQLTDKAERMCRQLRMHYKNGNKKVSISASIGIFCIPKTNCSYDQILANADTALYEAKSRGRNTFVFFHKMGQNVFSNQELAYNQNENASTLHNNEN